MLSELFSSLSVENHQGHRKGQNFYVCPSVSLLCQSLKKKDKKVYVTGNRAPDKVAS